MAFFVLSLFLVFLIICVLCFLYFSITEKREEGRTERHRQTCELIKYLSINLSGNEFIKVINYFNKELDSKETHKIVNDLKNEVQAKTSSGELYSKITEVKKTPKK